MVDVTERSLDPMASPSSDRPIVILGAGLSGLSLAHALCEAGVRQPIVLVDRRRSWERDRTWCTWQTGPLRFSAAITHRWEAWRTVAGERSVRGTSRRSPYVHLDAGRVYDLALARLDAAPTVELRLGEGVRSVEGGAVPRVHTSAGSLEAAVVFDALGANSPLERHRAPGATALAQRFLGWEIETDRPVFDPGTATLMDFRPHAGIGVTFMYVLAFSPTRALLEHTSIEPFDAAWVDREAALAAELRSVWGVGDWQVLRRERGLIPMSTHPFPARHAPGVHTLGSAAGAIRPSSGYAYSRIQRQVDRVAAALAAGRPLPARVAHPRHALLDRVFLHALRASHRPAELFLAAASVDGDIFARFMTDASSPAEEAQIIAALPVLEMTRAALGSASSPRAVRELLRGL
jgi:lycopene beta-cyclase